MRLLIEHETRYHYDEAVDHSSQYLRLTPRRDPCQTTHWWEISGPGRLVPWTDGFGNAAHLSVQHGPQQEVAILVRGEVETMDTVGILPTDDGLPPLMFLRETEYTRVEGEIPALAGGCRQMLEKEGPVPCLHSLMQGIAQAVEYRPGHTTVQSRASDVLAQGYGVCQDHAHLFIACCRVLKIPARYVSGYLHAGQGHLASHAWAEAFVEGLGWVSFDPSNLQSATDAYVRLAIGFDYASAGPVRGIRIGGGDEEMAVRVRIEKNGGDTAREEMPAPPPAPPAAEQ